MLRFKQYLLFEKQEYEAMFGNEYLEVFGKNRKNIANSIREDIRWAKRVLKKNDRIVWFLRILKLYTVISNTVISKFAQDDQIYQYNKKTKGLKIRVVDIPSKYELKIDLEHFMNFNIPEMDNFVFGWNLPTRIMNELNDIVERWKKSTDGKIVKEKPVFLKIDNTFSWYEVPNADPEESMIMGHCATSNQPNCLILSLREKKKTGKIIHYEPHLTFIYLPKTGQLEEMKGKGNNKPVSKYHKYIIPLLKDKRIKGVMGGGYLPENNFSVNDLSPKIRDDLLNKKSNLLSSYDMGISLRKKYDTSLVKRLMKRYELEYVENTDSILKEFSYNDILYTIYDGWGGNFYDPDHVDVYENDMYVELLEIDMTQQQVEFFIEYSDYNYRANMNTWLGHIKIQEKDLFDDIFTKWHRYEVKAKQLHILDEYYAALDNEVTLEHPILKKSVGTHIPLEDHHGTTKWLDKKVTIKINAKELIFELPTDFSFDIHPFLDTFEDLQFSARIEGTPLNGYDDKRSTHFDKNGFQKEIDKVMKKHDI